MAKIVSAIMGKLELSYEKHSIVKNISSASI